MARSSIVQGFFIFTLCGTSVRAQYENCTDGIIEYIGGGICDLENNNEGCLYDGGDCCQCSTIDDPTSYAESSYVGLRCVDPSSPCYSPTAEALQSNCNFVNILSLGNGFCDESNNNEGCRYDLGDCCECDEASSSFLCRDPSSPCYSPTAVTLQSSCTDGIIEYIADNWCDNQNNNEGCLYDGEDCCQCTGIDDGSLPDTSFSYYSSSISTIDFPVVCLDPSSHCYSPTTATLQSNCTYGDIKDIGDGWCDDYNNNEGCLYDGGDCCLCTSIEDGSSSSGTTSSSFKCVDPSSQCYSSTAVALQSNCTDGDVEHIGDGWCNNNNNIEGCLFDGGDCCSCTCVSGLEYECGSSGFKCLHPEVSDLEPYICDKSQLTLIRCIAGLQREWLIENATQVQALAEAVRCSGGSFNVTWNGKVIVDNTISIFDGTVLKVASIDADSAIVGDGKTRLFSVVNASLHLSNITVSNGNATYGGAIAASRSRLRFTRVSFIGNTATMDGGALHLSNGTSMSLVGDTSFLNNTASNGGAIYVTGGSSASWAGNASVSYNFARSKGGALYLMDHSSSIWTAGSHFLHNSAGNDGGAVYLMDNISVVWDAEAHFLNNSADSAGGTFYLSYNCSAIWTAEAHFLNNSAGSGGGLYLTQSSSAVWTAEAQFLNNYAESNGGALYLSYSISAAWAAEAHFLHNSADYGGALWLYQSSSAAWTAEAYFFNNSAESSGGALYVWSRSSVNWTAEAHFIHNSAELDGGALHLLDICSAVCTAGSYFLHNSAESEGGALHVRYGSSAVWTAEANFLHNTAGYSGGALFLWSSSSAVWTAEAHFLDNNAEYSGGGALALSSGSRVNWTAEAHFLHNNARLGGGALSISSGSSASWGGDTNFSENTSNKGTGGALYIWSSSAMWMAECLFSSNSALSNGGAVYAADSVSLSWSNKALFVDNTAKNGGALFVSNGVDTQLSGETNFTSNYARLNGGAVAHFSANNEGSAIAINGTTSFVNNKCGVNGGAISLVQSLALVCDSKDILFLQNSAGASGGAVYTVFTGMGIVFTGVAFVENVAQIGGGVRSTGSGTEVTVDKDKAQMNNPMTFERCSFIGNYAFATGGAVDSASGKDVFVRTSFEGNEAGMGGALRVAGIASIDNCSFEENVSELGGGPAVSNIGYMSNVTNSYFDNNVFKCEAQTFLHFNEVDDQFETICNGCPSTCFGCSFGEGQGSPTCMSLSEAGVEHATSKGAYTTVEELLIHKGYWRATNTSANVLRCFNTNACTGGLTGASDYCVLGYEGPYCSVCSENYISSLKFTCRKCSERTAVFVTATVLLALALVVVIAIVSYLFSAEVVGARRGIVDRVMERVPLQSVKIIIIVWQILTQFTSVTNVNFPSVYRTFLDGVNFLNFDLSWVLSTGCLLKVDFHDRLLWTTVAPLVIMGLLRVTYAITVYRHLTSPETNIRHIQHKHISMALLVTFLVYSSVSSVVFQMFDCDDLDDGKRYLRADYTIDCDSSKHKVLQIYSALMILVYPVGIPALYAGLLFGNRYVLREQGIRDGSPIVMSISNLWKPYKPQRFYYEIIECTRRIMLTGVIVFIYPNSAAQVAATFAIAVVFIFVSEGMSPYESPWDAWISRMGQAIIFSSMYVALLLKVNVSGENDASQNMFGAILVACHGCMILAVIVQIMIMVMSLRVGNQQVDPSPRLRHPSNSTRKIQAYLVEEDDISKDEL